MTIGSFAPGVLVVLGNYAVDFSFLRSGVLPHTYVLEYLIIGLVIGAAAGLLAYFWVSLQAARHAQGLAAAKLTQEAVHQERKRIALELHDTVCQEQTGALMHLECADFCLGENPEARDHLHRALQLVRRSMAEMRWALGDLYPEELQRSDLRSAIEGLIKNVNGDKGLHVQFSVDGTIRRLPPETEKGLLRISQEALSNVVKHAQAHEVRIELFLDSQRARLCVKDDGQGFQPGRKPGSLGLTSMRDRTKSMGGVWTIHSEPGRGTEVHASIPIPPAPIPPATD